MKIQEVSSTFAVSCSPSLRVLSLVSIPSEHTQNLFRSLRFAPGYYSYYGL